MKNPLRTGDKKPATRKVVEPESLNLSARRVRDNLIVTHDGTWAWFVLDPVQWAFQSPAERSDLLANAGQRWAELAGPDLHLRLTAHPMPYSVWAKRLHNESPNRLEEGWGDYLVASQHRIAETRSDTPGVYLGVKITKKRLTDRDLDAVTGATHAKLNAAQHAAKSELFRITEIMDRDAFHAQPVSERGLGWLIHRSVAIGHEVSENALAATGTEGWGEHDLDAFTAPVRVYSRPLSGCVNITASRDGVVSTNSVAFATVSRLSNRDTDYPVLAPWMAFPYKFPFPVEWSMIFKVVTGQEMRRHAEFYLTRARSIYKGFKEDHNEDPAPSVQRGLANAEQIHDEVTSGTPEVSARVIGPIRMAVPGATDEEALNRIRSMMSSFASNEQRIEFIHPIAGQYALYREFIPGEEHRGSGHTARAMKASYFATAVPNAATGLGDDYGPYLGQVIGSSRGAVLFDPTSGLVDEDNNESGLCVWAGGLGSGKSSGASVIVESHVRRGRRAWVLDPSGRSAKMLLLPHLRKVGRHVDLSGAKAGTLNPYRLVAIPRRESYDTDEQHLDAVAEAVAERRELLIDSLNGLLSLRPDLYNLLVRAVSECPAEYTSNPWTVVRNLQGKGDLERELADLILGSFELKGARLIFPTTEGNDADADEFNDTLLTIFSMTGLTTPAPGSDRAHWSRAERAGAVMMHLAARFVQRAMYADQEPKVIIVDEGGVIGAAGSSFQTFMLRGSRDSRKHNTFFAVLVQNPADVVALSPEIHNLVGPVFMGRLKGKGPRKAALELLGVETDAGYEGIFGALRSGEFVMRDYNGRVDTMRVDLEHRPDLKEVVYTTPPGVGRGDEDAPVMAELVLSR